MQRRNSPHGPDGAAYGHEEGAELLGAYALGAVTREEANRLELHLADCPECRAELAELRWAVDALPLLAEDVVPPSSLRARIAEIGQPSPLPAKVVPFYRRPIASWVAAAVLLIAVVGMGIWNMQLRDEMQRQVVTMAVQPQGGAPVQATILYLPDRRLAVFNATQLPPLQPGQVYEMWLIQGNNPIPAGVFSRPDTQQAMAIDLTRYQVFALTVEPGPNGSPTPTSKPFAVAPLTH